MVADSKGFYKTPAGSQQLLKPALVAGFAFLVERLVEFLLYNPDFFPVLYTG
jgi:hypothetical protein